MKTKNGNINNKDKKLDLSVDSNSIKTPINHNGQIIIKKSISGLPPKAMQMRKSVCEFGYQKPGNNNNHNKNVLAKSPKIKGKLERKQNPPSDIEDDECNINENLADDHIRTAPCMFPVCRANNIVKSIEIFNKSKLM